MGHFVFICAGHIEIGQYWVQLSAFVRKETNVLFKLNLNYVLWAAEWLALCEAVPCLMELHRHYHNNQFSENFNVREIRRFKRAVWNWQAACLVGWLWSVEAINALLK
jgi:hypothetical protein